MTVQPGTMIAEQFRLLRTRVEMAGPGTVMITSALDNEGKTSCAVNLARALAMSIGGGVMLIDADLRHPSTAHVLGLRSHPGLVDVLAGDADWRACVQLIDEDRLRVIPAGTSSSLAPELLGSPRLTQLIAEVKAEYPRHFIVFDAPPLLLTVDPLVLARHVDHVLLVVRAGVTPRGAVMKAIESLGPERLRGIVFNGATAQLGYYYQYQDHYYRPGPSGDGTHSS
jgi:capsular exopolysaccharide synthesis family protein